MTPRKPPPLSLVRLEGRLAPARPADPVPAALTTPATGEPGQAVAVKVAVQNAGGAAAKPVTVEYRISTDEVIDGKDRVVLTTQPAASLPAGRTAEATRNIALPAKAYSYYARETRLDAGSTRTGGLTYEVAGLAPFFWLAHEAGDDGIPTRPGTGTAQTGRDGRVAAKVNVSLAHAADGAFAGLMFGTKVPTAGSATVDDADYAPGNYPNVNKPGNVEVSRRRAGDGSARGSGSTSSSPTAGSSASTPTRARSAASTSG